MTTNTPIANLPDHLQGQVAGYELSARRAIRRAGLDPAAYPKLVHTVSRRLELEFWGGVFRERTGNNIPEMVKLMRDQQRWVRKRDEAIEQGKVGNQDGDEACRCGHSKKIHGKGEGWCVCVGCYCGRFQKAVR